MPTYDAAAAGMSPLGLYTRPADPDDTGEGAASPLAKVSMTALFVVGVLLACYVAITSMGVESAASVIAALFAVGIATILASFPVIIGFVQATSRMRQIHKLEGIQNWPVAQTIYYVTALSNLRSLKPALVTHRDYRVPMIFFCVTVIVCNMAVFLCCNIEHVFEYKSFVLGGMDTFGKTPTDISKYQSATFVTIAFAFIGAYVSIINRLLYRINNNDIYPISFHFYTAWIIMACLIAAVLRHVLDIFPGLPAVAPILVGFGTGLAPNLFLTALARRAFAYFNIVGDKKDPDQQLFPTNMNLLMIDGITIEQIDRLSELGITNAQVLSNQNPFVLWPRLPCDLSLLIDWIAQAQLYRKVRDAGFSTLRANQIGDIFQFHTCLSAEPSRATVCGLLTMPETMAQPIVAGIEADATFVRLRAVRDAMTQT